MIGQINLRTKIDDLIDNDLFPRFTILVGQFGSGKKLMCGHIARTLKRPYAFIGVGVDDVKEMINEAYKNYAPMVYVIADADKMSAAAKNALLKVTEEPPQNASFILTLTDLNSTLGTIRSRGQVLYMDPYSRDEILEIHKQMYPGAVDETEVIGELCETPGEVMMLHDAPALEMWDYVEKVIYNIDTVSGSNAFKISQKIKMKDTDTGYDLRLFWKSFMCICVDLLREDPMRYSEGVKITSKYLQELRITGINRQSTFDMWLLDIRNAWRLK